MLVAEDELSDELIAAEIGITRATLVTWKKKPEFIQRVGRIRMDLRSAIVAQGIANKQNRIDGYVRRHQLLEQVITDRAAAGQAIVDDAAEVASATGELADVAPGIATGLLVRTYKAIGVGRDQRLVEEWAVDTGLLGEMRQTEKQVAQETGQWSESPAAAAGVRVQIIGVDVARMLGTEVAVATSVTADDR